MPASALWRPSAERVRDAQISVFARRVEEEWGVTLPDYDALHDFSIECIDRFWTSLWRFAEVRGDWNGHTVIDRSSSIADDRWFPGSKLNFAENMLRRRDDAEAVVYVSEAGERRALTFAELAVDVARVQAALSELGVAPGDRVVSYLPNVPEAITAMLATTSLGAVWASVAPDLSATAALDRLGQLGPTVLISADSMRHAGKVHPLLDRARTIAAGLPTLKACIVVGLGAQRPDLTGLPEAHSWSGLIQGRIEQEPQFKRFSFNHPAFVLFTSGTTGRPKCLVHGIGGPLMQFAKEHWLHSDIRRGDRIFRFTNTGWMMWNWAAGTLAAGATVVLFDGSPTHAGADVLFDLAERERLTLFGPSAKLLDTYAKEGLRPRDTHDLSALRTMFSGGMRVPAANYAYVYENIKPDLYFASSSGGTDLLAAFVTGNPAGPVHAGEAPVAALGMKIEILDEAGRPMMTGPGELVCASPFPSVPLGFWGDPDRSRMLDTYFSRYPGKWCHGDWIERTVRGGYVVHGRSDATLKAGGIRIGTSEIYSPLERMVEIEECAAVAQEWEGDSRIILFVTLTAGHRLDADLVTRMRATLRQDASPRHVPAHIISVPELPRNGAGKVMELAIRDVIHGISPRNRDEVSNAASLDHFRDLHVLQS